MHWENKLVGKNDNYAAVHWHLLPSPHNPTLPSNVEMKLAEQLKKFLYSSAGKKIGRNLKWSIIIISTCENLDRCRFVCGQCPWQGRTIKVQCIDWAPIDEHGKLGLEAI